MSQSMLFIIAAMFIIINVLIHICCNCDNNISPIQYIRSIIEGSIEVFRIHLVLVNKVLESLFSFGQFYCIEKNLKLSLQG